MVQRRGGIAHKPAVAFCIRCALTIVMQLVARAIAAISSVVMGRGFDADLPSRMC